MTPRRAAGCAVLVCATLLTGCGPGDPAAQGARTAARSFTVEAQRDPGAACRLLAPTTRRTLERDGHPCSQALHDRTVAPLGEIESVEVAGLSARVLDTRGTAVFLALFDDGWRVTAAGCHRVADDLAVPYDCAVEEG